MLKLGKIATALALGLTMALSLFSTGAFAQSVNSSNADTFAHMTAATDVLQRADKIVVRHTRKADHSVKHDYHHRQVRARHSHVSHHDR